MIVMPTTMILCLPCFGEYVEELQDENWLVDWADFVSSDEEYVDSDDDMSVDDGFQPDELLDTEEEEWPDSPDVIMEEFSPTPSTVVPTDSTVEFSPTCASDSDSCHPNVSDTCPSDDVIEIDNVTVASSVEPYTISSTSSSQSESLDHDDVDID